MQNILADDELESIIKVEPEKFETVGFSSFYGFSSKWPRLVFHE